MSAPESIAASDTLLGLLQCGRGEGYRRALCVPQSEAADLLIECITHDPRIDTQVESRDTYYASLILDLALSLEPLAQHLRQHDDPTQFTHHTTLTVTTLTELAKRDYQNARDLLCDYIRWGQWWDWPIDELLESGDTTCAARIARAIEDRFPSEDSLTEALRSSALSSFSKLSPHSSRIEIIAQAQSKSAAGPHPPLPDFTTLSPSDLLLLANEENCHRIGYVIKSAVSPADEPLLVASVSLDNPFVTYVALRGLAKLAPPSLYPWLKNLWLSLPEKSGLSPTREKHKSWVILRRALSDALLALPRDITLPAARDWLFHQDNRKRDLAKRIMRAHATPEDIHLLRQAAQTMLSGTDDDQWDCFLLEAFTRFPNIDPIPELIDIYHHFRFSTGRAYAAEALHITSPDLFKTTLALESLWDCEADTRTIAAQTTPLDSEEARLRIEHLAHDPLENRPVREAATLRLTAV